MALGEERSVELSGIVNAFILRRTNRLLSAHLPPKVGVNWPLDLCYLRVYRKQPCLQQHTHLCPPK